MNDSWIVLLGALFGGAGLKIVEYLINRLATKVTTGKEFRDELRDEIKSLRDQLENAKKAEDELEKEIELWRSRYYDLRDAASKLETELIIALEKLKHDAVVPEDDA